MNNNISVCVIYICVLYIYIYIYIYIKNVIYVINSTLKMNISYVNS